MAALSVALVVVALIALSAFGLVLVLARRLRAVTERVNMFLPASGIGLPDPGTPVPEFSAVAVDGTPVTTEDLRGPDRMLAMLTTDCAQCHDQVSVLRDLDSAGMPRPIAVVIGPPEDRAPMVAALRDHALVIEEPHSGPLAETFDVHEFPAVIVAADGHVRGAEHGVAKVLAAVGTPVTS